MQLNSNIRQYRKSKNLSQDNVADLLGMTQPNYSKVEANFIDEPMLLRIANALKTTPDFLQNYHQPPKKVSTPEDLRDQLLCQKDETIRVLDEQIRYFKSVNADLQTRLADYLQGGVNDVLASISAPLPEYRGSIFQYL